MQSLLEADRIIGHYSNKIKYPEDYYPMCCKCNEFAVYKIGKSYYCDGCITEVAEETLPFEGGYCEYCGEDIEGDCIKISGDLYHRECFERSYSID